jgi:hypothetical protein
MEKARSFDACILSFVFYPANNLGEIEILSSIKLSNEKIINNSKFTKVKNPTY